MKQWKLLNLEPCNDKKQIKRAYARIIKTIDPVKQPEQFQKIREAYEYLLEYIQYEDWQDNIEQDDEVDSENSHETVIQLSQNENEVKISGQVSQLEIVDNEIFINEDQKTDNTIYTNPVDVADEFIQSLEDLYQKQKTLNLESWIEALDKEELHYLEVSNLLRFQTFGFFLEKIEEHLESKLKPVPQWIKLPEGFNPVLSYYAKYFDWKHTELLLANYYTPQQMKALASIAYPNEPANLQTVTEQDKSETKHYWIWIVAIFFLFKFFSKIVDDKNNKPAYDQDYIEQLSPRIKKTQTCSWLSNIKSDAIADNCLQFPSSSAAKENYVIAVYWILKLKKEEAFLDSNNNPTERFSLALTLLKKSEALNYAPAIELLAGLYINGFPQLKHKEIGADILKRAADNGSIKAQLLLLSLRALDELDRDDKSRHYDYLAKLKTLNKMKFSPNENFAMGTLYQLGIYLPQDTIKARQHFEFAAETVNARMLNNTAWYFATTKENDFDSELAFTLASQFHEKLRNSQDYRYIDTLAAAYAAGGHFPEAVAHQNIAIALFKKSLSVTFKKEVYDSKMDSLQELQQNLDLYEQHLRKQSAAVASSLKQNLEIFLQTMMHIDTAAIK